jgi:LuxR family maltose regulon positive regulatory protein
LELALPPTNPLLAIKLHVPRPRPHLVHRPRLIQQLEQGRQRALTLLSAPVGFGKSTLLSDWLASRAIPVAWLSLEPQDNEPVRFLSYLLAALQTYDPHLGTTRQVPHHPLHPPLMEAMLTLLINELLIGRGTAQEHFVLVLDNYHVMTDESIRHALSFLLEHRPPHMHLVLATREDPSLPLAHLRGRDDVLELRASDLRFTQEEAATFLREVMGLPLSAEESALLQARTEGWITGLQLAALSLQGRDDPGAFITAFNGSDRYVVDYLLEEVLHRQSEAVQEFLLQTCILDRLSAPLCDAVRQQGGSRALLDFLERTNLFLVALDDERQWYRYHRLFAEALRHRLQQTAPALVPHLHLRASRWYKQHGLFAQAASCVLAAPVPQPDTFVEPLTARERAVLQLLLDGASNREIACDLVLSLNTVKKHVSNIYGKLTVRNRVQVIAKARELHLLY